MNTHRSVTKCQPNINPSYHFNFRSIEDQINATYVRIREAELDNDKNELKVALSEMYQLVADMMFGIFSVNPPEYFSKNNIDFYEESCNFALYIIKKIETKKINWDYTIRHAWTWYFKTCARFFHYSYPKINSNKISYDKLIEDLEPVLSDASSDEPPFNHVVEDDYNKILWKEFFDKIILALQVYYEKSEIYKMLPLVLLSIQSDVMLPEDISKFRGLFLVTVKRLVTAYTDSKEDLPISIDASINKSTIILILLAYLSSEENQMLSVELMSSLDFLSLTRLALVAGGKEIYIPRVDELEGVVAAAVSLADILIEGSDFKVSRRLAKQFVGYSLDVRRLNKYMQSMLSIMNGSDNLFINYFGTKCETPFFNDLVRKLQSVSECQDNIIENLNQKVKDASPEDLIKCLAELGDSEQKMVSFIERLIKIKDSGLN